MSQVETTLTGVIHGKMIEILDPQSFPEGAIIKFIVVEQSSPRSEERLPPGEGLRRSAGAWADDGEELDAFIEWTYAQRRNERSEIEP